MPVITRPFLPVREPVVRVRTGIITPVWQRWAQGVQGAMDTISRYRGAVWGTLTQQPTSLGSSDEGLLYMVTDFGHVCRWSGSVWQFAPGDEGNGFVRDFPVAPQMASWWALCNGGATTYLVVGAATLTTLAFTTPNLQSGAYRKGGTYTGSIVAAQAPGISGSVTAEATHRHQLGDDDISTAAPTDTAVVVDVGTTVNVPPYNHFHVLADSQMTDPGESHAHGVGTLAVDAEGEPDRLVCPAYFRR